ncbi:MAG TPA: hypothetical protein VFA80_17675 [Xanthobacteraceae bacterium]|nr:hypothetical protein [Xanthobacteraceae bacterium]
MAIYGVGAFYEDDVSSSFIANNLVGVGWSYNRAADLHQFMRSLKVGDIVYIKAARPGQNITVKAIGLIIDDQIRDDANSGGLVHCGRNVRWASTTTFTLPPRSGKNNVQNNTLYEEFDPQAQTEIMARIISTLP